MGGGDVVAVVVVVGVDDAGGSVREEEDRFSCDGCDDVMFLREREKGEDNIFLAKLAAVDGCDGGCDDEDEDED